MAIMGRISADLGNKIIEAFCIYGRMIRTQRPVTISITGENRYL